jgi:hypothetical protein
MCGRPKSTPCSCLHVRMYVVEMYVCVSTLYVYINIYYVWQAQKHPVQLPDAVCDLLDLIEHFTGTQVI